MYTKAAHQDSKSDLPLAPPAISSSPHCTTGGVAAPSISPTSNYAFPYDTMTTSGPNPKSLLARASSHIKNHISNHNEVKRTV